MSLLWISNTCKEFRAALQTIHDNDFVASATCVDIGRGLYLVQRGFNGGFGFPIHVKVLETSSDGTCVECEHDSCMDGLRVA